MQKNYTKQKILELLINETSKDTKLKDNVLRDWNTSGRNKKRILDLLKDKIQSNAIDTDELIWVYDIVSKYVDTLPEAGFVFEEQELKNAFYNTRSSSKVNLVDTLKSKGCLTNPERKAQYITEEFIEKDANEFVIINTINRFTSTVADVENLKNKDLCDFETDDFIELFKGVTTTSFNQIKSFYIMYSAWCLNRAYNSQSDYDLLKNLTTGDIIQKESYETHYFTSLEEIQSTMDEISSHINSEWLSEHIVNNIVYTTIYLAWIGFDIDETLSMKREDVNVEERKILSHKTNKVITDIPETIMNHMKSVVTKSSDAYQKHLLYSERIDSANELRKNYIFNKITVFSQSSQQKETKKLLYSKIRESGNFCRMYEFEKTIGEPLTIYNLEQIKQICYLPTMSKDKCFKKINEYKFWKKYLLS